MDKGINFTNEKLPPTHPTRLGLALSCAVFTSEILNDKKTAFAIAKKAFDEGLEHLDEIEYIIFIIIYLFI